MKTRLTSVLVLLLFLTQLAYAQVPEAGFDEYVRKAMKEWEVPGLAIAIVKDDKVVFAKGYGVREIGGTAAATIAMLGVPDKPAPRTISSN